MKILKQLLTNKKTDVISGFVSKTGMKFDAPLKLTDEGDITFDFPEKPKPAESDVKCPKCGKNLMKTQWKYECECGFEVWHTIAKVELTEEIMTELLTTGKTKNKVAGFTSKAGNIFDSCLKYENGQISFDFDNPGEADPAAESMKAENAGIQNAGVQSSEIQNSGMQSAGERGLEMQSSGMQSAGVQNSEMQSSGIESPEMNSGSEANNVTDNNANDTQDIGIPEDFMAGLEIPQEDDQNNISDADMAAAYELFEN